MLCRQFAERISYAVECAKHEQGETNAVYDDYEERDRDKAKPSLRIALFTHIRHQIAFIVYLHALEKAKAADSDRHVQKRENVDANGIEAGSTISLLLHLERHQPDESRPPHLFGFEHLEFYSGDAG